MSFKPEQIGALQAPLDSRHVKGRSQGGRTVSYVEGWHAIAEANRIFGFDMWNRETTELRQLGEPRDVDGKMRVGYSARVRITVVTPDGREIVREGCGFGQGIDKDVDQAHESALKEAETDAMKRALMTFGNPFGLALYDKTQANVVDEAALRQAEATVTAHIESLKAATTLDALQTAFGKAWKAVTGEEPRARLKAAYDTKKAELTPAGEQSPFGNQEAA